MCRSDFLAGPPSHRTMSLTPPPAPPFPSRGPSVALLLLPLLQAARTNGSGVLQFSRVFDSLAGSPTGDSSVFVTPPAVHLVTFSYNRGGGSDGGGGRGGFIPAQPVGSALRQLFWLCSQVRRRARCAVRFGSAIRAGGGMQTRFFLSTYFQDPAGSGGDVRKTAPA